MLARAVDAREGFFMQQAGQPMPPRGLAQHGHDQLIVIRGQVGRLEHGRDFVLAGRGFVMAGAHRHPQTEQSVFHIHHEGQHPTRNDAVVLVLEFLPLGRTGSEQGASGHQQIGPGGHELIVDEKILLLQSAVGYHGQRAFHPEQAQHAQRLATQSLARTQKRSLFIQGEPRPG